MKLSISLSEEDLAALDRYADAAGLTSRSAAIQRAIRMLGDPSLDDAYAAAWEEWESSGDAAAWDSTLADGLVDAAQ
jgi:Arc/MetJ-type ribon-helix-helix transcriptional regulator